MNVLQAVNVHDRDAYVAQTLDEAGGVQWKRHMNAKAFNEWDLSEETFSNARIPDSVNRQPRKKWTTMMFVTPLPTRFCPATAANIRSSIPSSEHDHNKLLLSHSIPNTAHQAFSTTHFAPAQQPRERDNREISLLAST